MKEKLSPIFAEIVRERIRQNGKWGEQNHPMLNASCSHEIDVAKKEEKE